MYEAKGPIKYEAVLAKTFLACVYSQYHYFVLVSGGQASISSDDSFFCRNVFLKAFNIKRIIVSENNEIKKVAHNSRFGKNN